MPEHEPIDLRVNAFPDEVKAVLTDIYDGNFGGGAMPLYTAFLEQDWQISEMRGEIDDLELQLESECEEHGQTVSEWAATLRDIVEKEHHGYHEVAWMWCTHAACVLIRDHT